MKKQKRLVRHRIKHVDLGLLAPKTEYHVGVYRERFEAKVRGQVVVLNADCPKLTVVTQAHRDIEAHSVLTLMREQISEILGRKTNINPRVVLNGNRKHLYWTVRS